MNKLIGQELNRLVTEEPWPPKHNRRPSESLGHLLSTTFASFEDVTTPHADELLISPSYANSVRPMYINRQSPSHGSNLIADSPNTKLPLWDTAKQEWNWVLPGVSSVPSAPSAPSAPSVSSVPTPHNFKLETEDIFAAFFNALTRSLAEEGQLSSQLSKTMQLSANRIWSGAHSTISIKGEAMKRKPDIIMSNSPNPGWADIRVIAELTSSKYRQGKTCVKSLDSKAYLILKHQPWRRFVLMLSFCNNYRELRVHTYDRSGGAISRPFDINEHKDDFVRIFSCIVFGEDECIGFDTTTKINTWIPKLPLPSHHSHAPRQLRTRKRNRETPESYDTDTDDTGTDDTDTDSNFDPGNSPSSSESTFSPISSTPLFQSDHVLRTAPARFPHTHPAAETADNSLPAEASDLDLSDQPPIGKIKVNENWYDILKIIFSGHGLVGRGTVCYLTRRDNQEYIIKDHWVLGSAEDSEVLNEVTMLKKMEGVPGVPVLVDYCQVKLLSGDIDNTKKYRYKELQSTRNTWRTHVRLVMKPRGRCLEQFRTKKELIGALRDIAISECLSK